MNVNSDLAAFRQAIGLKYAQRCQGVKDRNAQKDVASYYHPDVVAIVARPGQPEVMLGHAGLEALYGGLAAARSFNLTITSVKSYVNGDSGWDIANFTINPEGEPGMDYIAGERAEFGLLTNWARIDGDWRATSEVSFAGSVML